MNALQTARERSMFAGFLCLLLITFLLSGTSNHRFAPQSSSRRAEDVLSQDTTGLTFSRLT